MFKFKWLAGVFAVVAVITLALALVVPPKDDRLPIPDPNAYDYFVRAGRFFVYDMSSVTNDGETPISASDVHERKPDGDVLTWR